MADFETGAGESEHLQQRARATTLAESSTSTTPATPKLAVTRAGQDDQRRRRYDRWLATAPKRKKGASQSIPRAADLKFCRRHTIKWHTARSPRATTGTAMSATRAKPPASTRSAAAKRLVHAPHQKNQSIKAFFQRQSADAKRARDDATPHITAHCEPRPLEHSPGQSVGDIDSGAEKASGPT